MGNMKDSVSGTNDWDRNALVRLVVKEHVKIKAFIHSIVRDESICDDVYQDLCVLAVEKTASIRDELHLMRWLRTSARYLSIHALRKRDRAHRSLDDGIIDLLEPDWRQRDGDPTADWHVALRHCVDLLPKRARSLVEQRYVKESSYEQISAETGRPIASLYVTFSRLLTVLRACITQSMQSKFGAEHA
jgi:RNA polymerase sigma-70 factor (ECF subfamily)